MELLDIIKRTHNPEPWSEGEKIPWNEPDFSARMLREHLSQDHDAASRRSATIDRQVRWIQQHWLPQRSASVLDLGCGPGLYANRLALLGHQVHGIDFGPASIDHAQRTAREQQLDSRFTLADIRLADMGGGHDLVMFIYGEFNVFRPEEARDILAKAWAALGPGGALLLEPHTFAAVKAAGLAGSSWYGSSSGLFSPKPHLCLEETFWHADQNVATTRYYIVDAATGTVTRHAASMQAYTDEQYAQLLLACGFEDLGSYPSLTGEPVSATDPFLVLTARRPA